MTVPYQAIPNGWFVVATTKELPAGRVVERSYFGHEWVLWRDASGVPTMQAAHCPHLGAHLGSGQIARDRLRCPFHGLLFARDGRCVASPDGRRPPRARLETLPLRERAGLVLAYWHAERLPPDWEPPDLDEPQFCAYAVRSRTLRGHPQEICENSSDLAHFGPTHGYAKPRFTSPPRVEGPVLRASYAVERDLGFIGMPNRSAPLLFSAEVFGLGFSRVRARIPAVGIEGDLLVLPTPISADRIELRFAARVKRSSRRWLAPLALLVRELLLRGYEHDLTADVPIWRRKRYEPRPALMEGEQAIVVYRRFAERFYSADDARRPHVPVSEHATRPRRPGGDPPQSRSRVNQRVST